MDMGAASWRERRAARVLRKGGIVVHPTEAVFGLAACAGLRGACDRVRRLKGRGQAKPFLIVVARTEQLAGLVELEVPLRAEILASWPGPHTWVLPADRRAPRWLQNARGGIAVRVTAHPQVRALCELAGPMISTSANASGHPPARLMLAARRYFGARVDDYLVGRLGGAKRPSILRDGLTGQVLRA